MSFVVMISSTPVSGSDYGLVNNNRVGFVSCQKEKCIDVTIVDDTVHEDKEQFKIHLRRTPDHGRNLELDQSAVDGVIEITDNDRYVLIYYSPLIVLLLINFLYFLPINCSPNLQQM